MRLLKSKDAEPREAAPRVDAAGGSPADVANPFRREPLSRDAALRAAGIETEASAHAENRRLNAISILVPITGTAAAIASWPFFTPTNSTLAIFALFFVLNGFGVTLGLHRYFTHRAFETSPLVAALLAVFGTWSFQGPIARWVADHRRHHRFSDRQFDPHSPYWDDDGPIASKARGFLHSHLLWMFAGLRSSEARYASDIEKSRIAGWASRHYWLVAASGVAAPSIIGWIVGGVPEMIACGLWAGFARVALLHQLTWSVNSFGHMLGTKPEGANDQARDNPVLALLILGEGLHGFHHRFPSAAIKRPLRYDATGGLILLLERLGVVWNVNRAGGGQARAACKSSSPRAEDPPAA